MRAFTLLLWEIRATVRGWMSSRGLRYGVAITLLVVIALVTAVLLVLPSAVRRGALPSARGFATFMIMAAGSATAGALAGGVAFLREPERWRLFRLSPLPDHIGTLVPIAAVAAFGVAACGALTIPFMVVTILDAPWTALVTGLGATVALAWSVILALALLVFANRLLGRQRAIAFAGTLPLTVVLAMPLSLPLLNRLPISPPTLWLWCLASFAALPVAARRASRGFVALLQTAEEPRFFPEPQWGRPSWTRRLFRTDALPGFMGCGLLALITAASDSPVGWGPIALFIVLASTVPLWHLWKAEYECPDRWRLAPEGARMRRSLFIRVGGTSAAVAFAIALALGANRPVWVMEVAVLLALAPFTFLVYAPWLRGTLQFGLMFAALLTGVGH